ncbi:hypothetical protein DFH06DRAFT_1334059 [Mycena polygramma]|nr:hypothetical protein DFH06DRAFT_1334059 [Mycena polygramma]
MAVDDLRNYPVHLLTRWEYVRHGPVRPGITTTALQNPSGYQPPAAVVHEEDAEMKDGDAPSTASTATNEGVAGTEIPLPASPESPSASHNGEEEIELNAGVTLGTTPVDSDAAKDNTKDA